MTATSTADAQPSHRFPDSFSVQYDGVTYRAFNLGAVQDLLKIDADLVTCTRQLEVSLAKSLRLQEQVTVYLDVIKLEQDTSRLLQESNTALFAKWAEENKRRHEAENKPSLSAVFGWSSTALLGILTVVTTTLLVAR